MTYNTILVQLDVDLPVAPTLNFGLEVAGRFDADLIAFAAAEAHVFIPGDDGGIVGAELLRRQTKDIEDRLKAMREEFFAIAGQNENRTFRGVTGNPTLLLATHARAADLIIVGTPPGGGSDRSPFRTVDCGSLVLSAGRPVLLAATDLSAIRTERVIVAWKDTRESRRAVLDAMPFLKTAKEVVVLTIEEGSQRDARASTADVVRFLTRHGVGARAEVIGIGNADVEEALSQIARETGADLIVAGAYGHSRLREWAFGGMTRSLLGDGSLHRLISN